MQNGDLRKCDIEGNLGIMTILIWDIWSEVSKSCLIASSFLSLTGGSAAKMFYFYKALVSYCAVIITCLVCDGFGSIYCFG